MAPCPPPPSTHSPLLRFFCLFGRSAKRLRKLPAPSPSGALSWGPRTHHRQGTPLPLPLRMACSLSGLPTATPRISQAHRWRPRKAASGAAAPPAGRWNCAELAGSEVLNFTLQGSKGRVSRAWLSETRGREFWKNMCHAISRPLLAAHSSTTPRPQPLLGPPHSFF